MRWVISFGGSLFTDAKGDVNKPLLLSMIKTFQMLSRKYQLLIVTGGGQLARTFIAKAKALGIQDHDALDWLGIQATRMHAQLLIGLLKDAAYPSMLMHPEKKETEEKEKILVAGGSEPGQSTDAVAVSLAITYQAQGVINLSNVPYIYTADPKKDPAAQAYETIHYQDLLYLLGDFWEPGRNIPFDPKAIKQAQEKKIPVYFLKPTSENLIQFLTTGSFEGTLIHDEKSKLRVKEQEE